ncbi:MAG: radical SAM protein [Lachnospiraceae bacterium]
MEHFVMKTTIEKLLIQKAVQNRKPITGTLELLPLCNMRCDMCYIRLNPEEMKLCGRLHAANEWIELAEQMRRSGVLFLLLTGGEPLLFPEFRKLYLKLKEMGMILSINTNGTLLNEEWADFFQNNKPRRINITLYGADDEAYENLCHYPGGFEKTIQSIKLLKERGVDIKINGSVTKQNFKDMEKIYQIGKELDISVHMDTYILPGIRDQYKPFKQQARLNPEDSASAYIHALKSEMSEVSFHNYILKALSEIKENAIVYPDCISCQAGNSSFAIGWQGAMRPCVSMSQPFANVFEIGFDASWEKVSKAAGNIRINRKCTKCHLRPICNTCAASAIWETGSSDAIPSYNCKHAEELLRLLYRERNNI